MSDRIRFQDLDGLRALAALAVVLYHMALWLPVPEALWAARFTHVLSFGRTGGPLGVTVFFILSGFLITYLMMDERRRTGRLHIGRFYMRRILRIWPLYFATLAISFLLCEPVAADGNVTRSMYLLFLANFDHILRGEPACGMLGVQWSVCVEEQFYLIWPLFFALLGHRRSFPWAMLAVFVASSMFAFASEDFAVRYYHLFSTMRYLVCGGLLAYAAFQHGGTLRRTLAQFPVSIHAVLYACGIGLLFIAGSLPMGAWRSILMHVLPIVFFTYVLAHQTHGPPSWLHLRNFPLLGRLGRASYGLYLIHMIPIALLARAFAQEPWAFWYTMPLALLATVLLSEVSYRYLESPFLKLKSRFGG
jgi:peptidoglycan/LPS O-acetylase OafA/YrhL